MNSFHGTNKILNGTNWERISLQLKQISLQLKRISLQLERIQKSKERMWNDLRSISEKSKVCIINSFHTFSSKKRNEFGTN